MDCLPCTLLPEILAYLPLGEHVRLCAVSRGLCAAAGHDAVWEQLFLSQGAIAHPLRGWGAVPAARVLRAWRAFGGALAGMSVRDLRAQAAQRRVSTAGLLEKGEWRARLAAASQADAPPVGAAAAAVTTAGNAAAAAAAAASDADAMLHSLKRVYVAARLAARLAEQLFAASEVAPPCHRLFVGRSAAMDPDGWTTRFLVLTADDDAFAVYADGSRGHLLGSWPMVRQLAMDPSQGPQLSLALHPHMEGPPGQGLGPWCFQLRGMPMDVVLCAQSERDFQRAVARIRLALDGNAAAPVSRALQQGFPYAPSMGNLRGFRARMAAGGLDDSEV